MAVINLKAEKELAFDSPDHIMPWGTRHDNSRNRRFNSKIYSLHSHLKTLKILDIGCAGGGFVADCLNDGHIAVGLEGSDWSRKYQRAEWAHIPQFLFTCDVTRNFDLYDEKGNRIMFDFVTAWEMLEHIKEADISGVITNIKKHLLPTGLLIVSISTGPDIINGVNLHQTTQPRSFWVKKFAEHEFIPMQTHLRYFNGQFIREASHGDENFHLVLSCAPDQAPAIPKTKTADYLFDKWHGSKWQKLIYKLIS